MVGAEGNHPETGGLKEKTLLVRRNFFGFPKLKCSGCVKDAEEGVLSNLVPEFVQLAEQIMARNQKQLGGLSMTYPEGA